MVDMHSHFLPGIDDGAKNIEESVTMLKHAKAEGTDTAVATPHIKPYCPEDIKRAL